MSTLFVGNTHVSGKEDVVRFGALRFWAERGIIHVENERDAGYESLSVRVALQRINAISEMLGNNTHREMYSEDQFDRCNRLRHQNMVDGLMCLIEKARIQGMPDDPSARRDLVRRAKKSVVVPAFGGGM